MAGNIFISYRRDDAAAWAGRLHMALERHFRRDQIFMDVDSIKPGLDFAKVIDAEVAKCDVMLVVIGKDWLDVRDAAGQRRPDDPGDFVRLEVESALRRDIRVVPVLVDGARLPKAEDLPEGMQGLVRRQAWPLSHARFGAESEGLIGEISRYVTTGGGAAAAPARTDWAGEASWFFLLSIAGLGSVGLALPFFVYAGSDRETLKPAFPVCCGPWHCCGNLSSPSVATGRQIGGSLVSLCRLSSDFCFALCVCSQGYASRL